MKWDDTQGIAADNVAGDPTSDSRVNEWIAARESVQAELTGIYADQLAKSLEGVMHPFGPEPDNGPSSYRPFTPVTDPACGIGCKEAWMKWDDTQGIAAENVAGDPTSASRADEWIAARESVQAEVTGLYAVELAKSLDGVLHPFGPAPATQTSSSDVSQGETQGQDGSGTSSQAPATTTTGGNGVSFASEITGFISGAVCPKGNFQSVNNGVEDNTGASGACF